MEYQIAGLLFLVWVGLAAKIAVLGRCVFQGLWRGRLFFCAMVSLSAFVAIFAAFPSMHPYYAKVWPAAVGPLALLESAAAIEAFWSLAHHFRNIRRFGLILMTIILAVSAAVAAIIFAQPRSWDGPLSGPARISQYVELFLVLVTLLTFGFFRQFSKVPIRPNAVRHLLILSLLAAFFFAGRLIIYASGGQAVFTSNLVVSTGAVLAFGSWFFLMKPGGEELPFEPEPLLPIDDFNAGEAEESRKSRELKRASDEALRKLRER